MLDFKKLAEKENYPAIVAAAAQAGHDAVHVKTGAVGKKMTKKEKVGAEARVRAFVHDGAQEAADEEAKVFYEAVVVSLSAAMRPTRAELGKGGAHLDAPAAVAHPAAEQASGVVQSEARKQVQPGAVALVGKGGDKIPVQLKDAAHLEKLREVHGAGNVQVQS